jgi:hypothetical protein
LLPAAASAGPGLRSSERVRARAAPLMHGTLPCRLLRPPIPISWL